MKLYHIIIITLLLFVSGCNYTDTSSRELAMVSIELGYKAHQCGWTLQETKDYVDKRMGWNK
jgi:hypothetical protein